MGLCNQKKYSIQIGQGMRARGSERFLWNVVLLPEGHSLIRFLPTELQELHINSSRLDIDKIST
jgi:hypothetical protein